MNDLTKSEGVSLLNLILPKESVVSVSEAITNAGAKGVFQISARGSVLNDGGFFQKMFPPPAPEQHLLQALVPDDKIEQFKSLIKKTHGDPEWMEEHAKRTGINSMDAFFADLPTGTAMIVVRDPAESLENWMKSDHPDDKGHLEEAMKIFGMTKEDIESSDQELKFEHVVSYQSSE